MVISRRLRQRFCKDMNISIQLFETPYFEDRIKLMGFEKDYNDFVRFVTKEFNNEEEYFAYYNELKDKMIDFIKNSEAYIALQEDGLICKKPSLNIKQGDTYKDSCVGKEFLSIDMKKANFSALVKYGKVTGTKFFDSYDYEKFIKQFTPYDYFVKSKYIRQVVFGNCNPKRQIAYETSLMSKVMNLITNNSELTGLLMENVYSLNSDEIIFDITGKDGKELVYNLKTFLSMTEMYDLPLRVEAFKVGKLEGTKAYVKIFNNGADYELKCVNPYEAPFVYRYINMQEPTKMDRYFLFEGQLARFENAPTINLVTDKKAEKERKEEIEEDEIER